MSKKEKSTVVLVIGLAMFMCGWAVRSTFVMHNFVNKPLGGAFVAAGLLVISYAAYKLLKKN